MLACRNIHPNPQAEPWRSPASGQYKNTVSRPEFLLDLVEPVEERDADADEDLLLRDLDSLGVPLLFQAWV